MEDEDGESDYSGLDLFREIADCDIGTICLDEAHHLKNEWQKALEQFIAHLDGSVRVISLTATPPHDASPQEWQHYIDVCGEIDDEIFVPKLVRARRRCVRIRIYLF